jgi:predicted metal-dependent hydrolase
MSRLQVRRIPFTFDGVDFIWNRADPAFSVFINCVSFWVLGLERYFVRVMRDAQTEIRDPAVREEAQLFLQQEAVHSAAHRRHVAALVDRHPGLQSAADRAVAHYDALYDRRDLRYHLAYTAGLEGTFTPVFGMIIDHRDRLFRDGDARVASLCLWHFCEEIEHRSSAVRVYDDVVGDQRLKLRSFPSVVDHVDRGFTMLMREFRRHVPGERDAAHYGSRASRVLGRRANPLAAVPVSDRVRVLVRAGASIRGGYDHEHQPTPAWADTWFRRYERGEDMTTCYGDRASTGAAPIRRAPPPAGDTGSSR